MLLSLLWGLAPGAAKAQNSISYTATSATIKFNIANYSFAASDVNQILNLSDRSFVSIAMDDDEYGIVADEGYPAIPQLPLLINLPANARNVSVTMRSSVLNLDQVPAGKHIEPFVNVNKDGTVEGTGFNANYYNTATTPYVSSFYTVEEPFFLMDEQALDLTVLPFQYVPTTGRLTVLERAEFVITWTLEGSVAKSPISQARASFFEDIFMSYTGNAPKSGKKGSLLIITAPQYEQGLTLFKEYKENIGIETEIVSTNTTGKSAGEIEAYIKKNASKKDFVLLVGSINDIPITSGNTSGSDIDNPATDYGYRCFKENANKYGDIFLGRWPVTNKTDLTNIINKTIFMESNLHNSPKHAYFLAGHEDNLFMRNSFKVGHFNAMEQGFLKQKYICKSYFQSPKETILSLADTYPAWFIYSGHGGASQMAYGVYSIGPSFFNRKDMFPFTFSFACLSGTYSYRESMASCILNTNGPVSYFGSTVNTYCSSDIAIETKILGKSLGQNHIGSIITKGMTSYARRFWSAMNRKRTKRYIRSYNLMGDPSILKHGCGIISTFNFNELFTAVGGINLTFNSTDAININQGLRMESGATLTFQPANTLLLKGTMATARGRLIGNSKKITLESNARINANSNVRLTANEFDFKPGFTIESGSDVIFEVK